MLDLLRLLGSLVEVVFLPLGDLIFFFLNVIVELWVCVCREYCILVSGCVCCKGSFPFFFLIDIMICSSPVREKKLFVMPWAVLLCIQGKKIHINSLLNE
jgi:hypothetical protein